MPGPLVVGYDGTPGAQAAAAEALSLASDLGAEVVFAFAYWTNPQGGDVADMLAALRDLGEAHLREALSTAESAGVARPRSTATAGSPTPYTALLTFAGSTINDRRPTTATASPSPAAAGAHASAVATPTASMTTPASQAPTEEPLT
jgi:hypothetical protein